MPGIVGIAGCGSMVCSTYEEMTAAIDGVYAVAEDQPIMTDQAFALLAIQAMQEVAIRPPSKRPEPSPE